MIEMTNIIEKYKFGNTIIEILNDDCSGDGPRDWDNLGTMVCFHKRYTLGDKDHGVSHQQFGSWDEMEEYLVKEKHAAVVLPMYMYDHSGITVNTKGFSCPWDSGRIGFIYVSREKLMKEYSVKKISASLKKKVTEYLEGEVKTYDQWLTGDVYGFKIYKEAKCDKCGHVGEEKEDSCYGFYGRNIKENGMLDHFDKELKEAFEQNKVEEVKI